MKAREEGGKLLMSIGRNDPCYCGSGKKYKKCCLSETPLPARQDSEVWLNMRRTEGKLVEMLMPLATQYYGKEPMSEAIREFFAWPEEDIVMEDRLFILEQTFVPWLLFNWEPDSHEPCLKKFGEIVFAKHYLKNHRHELSDFERQFIEANLKTHYSVYQVQKIEVGESMTLFDILREVTVTVIESRATQSLQVGQLIMARVLTMEGDSVCFGTYPIPLPGSDRLVFDDFLMQRHGGKRLITQELFEYDIEIRDLFIALADEAMSPNMPELHNTDGEKMVLSEVQFNLKVSVQEAFDALCDLSIFQTREEILKEAAVDADQTLSKVSFRWCEERDQKNHAMDNVLMGDIEISKGLLIIKVNSNERVTQAKKIVKQRLGKGAVYRDTHQETAEEFFEKVQAMPKETDEPDINELPEVQALLKKMHDDHWKRWPDMTLPALDGKTPREAAKTEAGRRRLEILLTEFHSSNVTSRAPFPVDLHYLRETLGMNE
jgi:uncharacterized protein YecA (UPF0149 family)